MHRRAILSGRGKVLRGNVVVDTLLGVIQGRRGKYAQKQNEGVLQRCLLWHTPDERLRLFSLPRWTLRFKQPDELA